MKKKIKAIKIIINLLKNLYELIDNAHFIIFRLK